MNQLGSVLLIPTFLLTKEYFIKFERLFVVSVLEVKNEEYGFFCKTNIHGTS